MEKSLLGLGNIFHAEKIAWFLCRVLVFHGKWFSVLVQSETKADLLTLL